LAKFKLEVHKSDFQRKKKDINNAKLAIKWRSSWTSAQVRFYNTIH